MLLPKVLQPSTAVLENLRDIYYTNFQPEDIKSSTVRLQRLDPENPDYIEWLAYSYAFTGEYDRGLRLLMDLNKNLVEDYNRCIQIGQLYLLKGDLDNARKYYDQACYSNPEIENKLSDIFDHISFKYNSGERSSNLKPITGSYRFEDSEMRIDAFIHINHLIIKSPNQLPLFSFQLSDSELVSFNSVHKFIFKKSHQNIINRAFYNMNGRFISTMWKEDSLILKAISLLDRSDNNKALSAFRTASAVNPDHYYLKNFIFYLELIQRSDYENIISGLNDCAGNYGPITILKKDDNFYYRSFNGLTYKLLPIDDHTFMTPSQYYKTIHIIRNMGTISGLEIDYRDGRSESFNKND